MAYGPVPDTSLTQHSSTGVSAQLCLWAPYVQSQISNPIYIMPPTNNRSMELCVGMICGTIPALRPLLSPKSSRSQEQNYYERYNSPYKLTPISVQPSKSSSQPNPPIFPSSKPNFSQSISQERIMAPHDLQQIRQTFEIEINNEAAGSRDGVREGHRNDWNVV